MESTLVSLKLLEVTGFLKTPPVGFEPTTGCLEGRKDPSRSLEKPSVHTGLSCWGYLGVDKKWVKVDKFLGWFVHF